MGGQERKPIDKIGIAMELALVGLKLVQGNEKKKAQAIINKALRKYGKIRRLMKRSDGVLDDNEKEQLRILMQAILDAQVAVLSM